MKYISNFNAFKINEADDLTQIVSDVKSNIKQFNKEYRDFLSTVKKINKKESGQQNIFKSKIVEQFAKFLEKYKITSKKSFDDFVKDSLIKDRSSVSLRKDFSEEAKYLDEVAKTYFDSLNSGKTKPDAVATSAIVASFRIK